MILPDSLRRKVSRNFADLDSIADQLIERVQLICMHERSADMAKGLINKFKERLYNLMPQLLDSVDQQAENILNANVVASVKATIIELGALLKGGTRENNAQYMFDIIVAASSRELTVHNVRDILGVRKHVKHNNVTAQETPSTPALDLSHR